MQSSKETKAKDFKEFLKRFTEEDSPRGDLAKDALSKSSQWTGKTAFSLKKNMELYNPCDEAKEALKELTLLYKENQKRTN